MRFQNGNRYPYELDDPPELVRPNGIIDWSLQNAVRRHVSAVLEYTSGDMAWAAEELGTDRTTVYRWVRSWRERRGGAVERGGRGTSEDPARERASPAGIRIQPRGVKEALLTA